MSEMCFDDFDYNRNDDIISCTECGCVGNQQCGVEPVDSKNVCALDQNGVCPCCKKLGTQANKKRWDDTLYEDPNQLILEL